jgi:hypothetical protein
MLLPAIVRRPVPPPRSLDLEVFSYSGEQTVPEQVASVRSFLRHAGRPKSFTIVSDGTHTRRSIRLLERIDSGIRVRPSTAPAADLPEKFREYLLNHPTGKQLALLMSLPESGPALYFDSDVLFFDQAGDLEGAAAENNLPAWYLADCQFSGDRRILNDHLEERQPVNTGVLLLFRKLDWSLAIDRFLKLDGAPDFFTNQTMAHLVMHAAGARPLDPRKYVLQLDDQFVYADRYASPNLVLRHYVNPVRHKFWTALIH